VRSHSGATANGPAATEATEELLDGRTTVTRTEEKQPRAAAAAREPVGAGSERALAAEEPVKAMPAGARATEEMEEEPGDWTTAPKKAERRPVAEAAAREPAGASPAAAWAAEGPGGKRPAGTWAMEATKRKPDDPTLKTKPMQGRRAQEDGHPSRDPQTGGLVVQQGGRARGPGSRSSEDLAAVERLMRRQRETMPEILDELKQSGRKVGHWAWWAFPTELPGLSEPGGATYVTHATAPRLFEPYAAPDDWRLVLEKVANLVEKRGMRVLPSIDHGRIHYFIKFWMACDASPDWMVRVLARLDAFAWSHP